MIRKQTTKVFAMSQSVELAKKAIGDNQPPIKSIATSIESDNMFLYSARKKSAKAIDEYSVLKPPTNSASASDKSKGLRFASASTEIKKTTETGNSGSIYHVPRYC